MKVSVFGTGYVGLVTGTCLAEVGNEVVCVDVDADKVRRLNAGEVPIFEPGLAPMVQRNRDAGRLVFTMDARMAVTHGEVLFIAVGTPPDEDGSADLHYVLDVARTIGSYMTRPKVIVDKSTVPVGTSVRVEQAVRAALEEHKRDVRFAVASNPEFLKEGAAVHDFMRPARIVIGANDETAIVTLHELYAPFNHSRDRVVVMDPASAELTKYAANAMLATKISFMNELSQVAERVGADIEHVRTGMGMDPRIGFQFIYPGVGYGGSCFPKDVKALARTARERGYAARLLEAVEVVNDRQKGHLLELVSTHFKGSLRGRTFALWGLAFKPNTDDMREAPSRVLLEALWQTGAQVRAYDPEARDEAYRIYGERSDLVLCTDAYSALKGANALIVVTEWEEFRSPNFKVIAQLLGGSAALFDGRNIYEPGIVEDAGIAYYGIARGRSLHLLAQS